MRVRQGQEGDQQGFLCSAVDVGIDDSYNDHGERLGPYSRAVGMSWLGVVRAFDRYLSIKCSGSRLKAKADAKGDATGKARAPKRSKKD
jgi:hypothetical protein